VVPRLSHPAGGNGARAALEFYRTVFGGRATVVTYADTGAARNPAEADLVMWGQVAAGNGFRVMAYDVPGDLSYDPGDRPVYVSVRGTGTDEITAFWKGLSDGATVLQDLGPAGWSPLYGMLRDRFGVTWVLDVEVSYG
jgi:PhnB protein